MAALTNDTLIRLMNGDVLTARRQASQPNHKAWVGVRSMEQPRQGFLNTVEASMLGKLRVHVFEVRDDVLEGGFDLHEDALVNSQKIAVDGALELERTLTALGVDPATLDYKSCTEYPL